MKSDLYDLASAITQNEDDRLFLSGIMERYPRVANGFRQFVGTPPPERFPLALKTLHEQPRTGWLRFELEHGPGKDILTRSANAHFGTDFYIFEDAPKTPETVLEHSSEAGELYILAYANHPHIRKQWGNEILKFHDFAEAIIGDFTPFDGLSKADKARLEGIAIDLLTESRHSADLLMLHVYNCLQIYEGRKTDFVEMSREFLSAISDQEIRGEIKPHQRGVIDLFTRLYTAPDIDLTELNAEVHDIDQLQMGVRGLRMMREKHSGLPEAEANRKMDEFWTYIDKKMTTGQGKAFFRELHEIYREEPQLNYKQAIQTAVMMHNNRSG